MWEKPKRCLLNCVIWMVCTSWPCVWPLKLCHAKNKSKLNWRWPYKDQPVRFLIIIWCLCCCCCCLKKNHVDFIEKNSLLSSLLRAKAREWRKTSISLFLHSDGNRNIHWKKCNYCILHTNYTDKTVRALISAHARMVKRRLFALM